MSRATFISGFCAGKANTDRFAQALYDNGIYEDVESFTFAEAMKHPDKIRKAAKNVPVITHSAGALALHRTQPKEIHALAPPLPAFVLALIGRGVLVAARMHAPGIGIHSLADAKSVTNFDRGYTQESVLHGLTNFRQLPAIGRFDGVATAIYARAQGIETSVVSMDDDGFYKLSAEREAEAVNGGVQVVRMPGEHNDALVFPDAFIQDYYNVQAA